MNRPFRKYAAAVNHKNEEYCGSDAYFFCDGRWSVPKCVVKAREHFAMINRNLGKRYYGFRIYMGKFPYAYNLTDTIIL